MKTNLYCYNIIFRNRHCLTSLTVFIFFAWLKSVENSNFHIFKSYNSKKFFCMEISYKLTKLEVSPIVKTIEIYDKQNSVSSKKIFVSTHPFCVLHLVCFKHFKDFVHDWKKHLTVALKFWTWVVTFEFWFSWLHL